MNRRCKSCKAKKDVSEMLFFGINAFCDNECYQEFMNKESSKCSNIKRGQINRISEKKKKRLETQGGEMDMFYKKIDREIQEKGEIRCQNPYCGRFLDKNILNPTSFAHILSKKDYPALRYFLNNIAIVCPSIAMENCHTKVDSLVTGNKLQIEKDILNGKRIEFKKK